MRHSVVERSLINVPIGKLESSFAVWHVIVPCTLVLWTVIELPDSISLPCLSFYKLAVSLDIDHDILASINRIVLIDLPLVVLVLLTPEKLRLYIFFERKGVLDPLLLLLNEIYHWLGNWLRLVIMWVVQILNGVIDEWLLVLLGENIFPRDSLRNGDSFKSLCPPWLDLVEVRGLWPLLNWVQVSPPEQLLVFIVFQTCSDAFVLSIALSILFILLL